MTSLWDDFKRARKIAAWTSLIAKRSLTMNIVLRWVLGFFAVLGVGALAASMTVVPLLGLTGSERASYAVLISVVAGALLLYLEIMMVYTAVFADAMSALLVAPLSGRTILLSRLYPNFKGAWIFVLMGLPMLVAYGVLNGAGPFYYVFATVSLICALLTILSMAVLIVLSAMFLLRKKPSRDTLAVVSAVVAILVFMGPRLFLQQNAATSFSGFGSMLSPVWNLLPLSWYGHSLISLNSDPMAGLLYLGLEAILAVAFFGVSLRIAQTSLHDRITRMDDAVGGSGRRVRNRGIRGTDAAQRQESQRRDRAGFGAMKGPAGAVFTKDLKRLRRTTADLVGYLFPTAYLLFFTLQSGNGGPSLVGLVPMFVIILASTMGRIPISSFGQEQDQVWLYMLAPIRTESVVLGKTLYGVVPTLIWWEVLAALLAIFAKLALTAYLAIAVGGLWLIPSSILLTMPFAIHGAAYMGRKVGSRNVRNVYVKPFASWYLAALTPYLAIQTAALWFATSPFLPGTPTFFVRFLIASPLAHYAVGLVVSLIAAVIAVLIGWSMSVEAWRGKTVLLLESGSLD